MRRLSVLLQTEFSLERDVATRRATWKFELIISMVSTHVIRTEFPGLEDFFTSVYPAGECCDTFRLRFVDGHSVSLQAVPKRERLIASFLGTLESYALMLVGDVSFQRRFLIIAFWTALHWTLERLFRIIVNFLPARMRLPYVRVSTFLRLERGSTTYHTTREFKVIHLVVATHVIPTLSLASEGAFTAVYCAGDPDTVVTSCSMTFQEVVLERFEAWK
jgi:hypothetical protein